MFYRSSNHMNKGQRKIVTRFLYFLGFLIVLGTAGWLYTIYNEELAPPYNPSFSDYFDTLFGINNQSHGDHPKPFAIILGSFLLLGINALCILLLRNSFLNDYDDVDTISDDQKYSSLVGLLNNIFNNLSSSPHDLKVKRFLKYNEKIGLLSQSAVRAYRVLEATKDYEHALEYYAGDESAQTSAKDLWKRTVRELENLPFPNYTTSSFDKHISEFKRLKESFEEAYQSIMTVKGHSEIIAARGRFGELAAMYMETTKQYEAAGLYCSNRASEGIDNLTNDGWQKESLSPSEIVGEKANWLNILIKSSDVISEAKKELEKGESIRKNNSWECLPY